MTRSLNSAGHAVACSRFLPAPLIGARAIVFDPLSCLDLNITARRALYGILTFLNIKDMAKAVWPRRDTLRAESLLQSDATLYRGLAKLEEKGYITRSQNRNAHNGKFHISPIAITQKAVAILGLEQLIHSTPSLEVRDGHIKKELTKEEQSYQKTTCSQAVSKKSGVDPKTRLPFELMPLLDLQVSKSAICFLMSQAKAKGKRLADVFKTVEVNVQGLRGKAVVGYLMAMLRKNLDFAWLAKSSTAADDAVKAVAGAKEKLKLLDSRYDGFDVLDASGKGLGTFKAAKSSSDLALVTSPSGSMPVNLRFAKAWMDGALILRPSRSKANFYEQDDGDEF